MHYRKILFTLGMVLMISGCTRPTAPVRPTQKTQSATTQQTNPKESQTAETGTGTTAAVSQVSGTASVSATNTPTVVVVNDTETPVPVQPSSPSLTPTPTEIVYPYHIQIGSPANLANFAHPKLACKWFGIAGQVFQKNGDIAHGILVEVGGTIGNKPVSGMSITGIAPLYGPGGYEIILGKQPIASRQTVWLQLHSTDGKILSDKYYINTYSDCSKNLIMVNFSNVKYAKPIYFPIINK